MKNLILFLSFILTVSSTKYNCTSDSYTIQLPPNEIAFFDSLNLLNDSDKYNCEITFVSTVENVRCYVTYRAWRGYYNPATFLLLNTSKFSTTQIENHVNVQYLEGSIVFDQWNDSCLLKSVSRDEPFLFTDESQVLYINNTFNGTHASSHPCRWQFKAPEGYGFKIIIEVFEEGSQSHLIIKNRTQILVNENSIKLNHPIYNSDTFIQIFLNNSQPNLKFLGIISIVQNKLEKTNGSCFGSAQKWSLHPEFGFYGNNQICTMELSIMPNTEILVSYIMNLGDIADYIGYYDIDNKLIKLDPNADDKYFMLTPYPNNKTIIWNFVSDGSIPGFGFDIGFDVIVCNCTKVITCPGGEYLVDGDDTYCSNLECEIIIESCKNNYTLFEMNMSSATRITTLDYFQIFSNDILVYETFFSTAYKRDHYVFLNSANKNVLKAKTFHWDHLQPRTLFFNNLNFEIPSVSHRVLLSFSNPSFVIDTSIHPLTYVEISDEMKLSNYTLEIHRSYYGDVYLFNNKNLTMQLNETCGNTKDKFGYPLDDFLYTCTIKNYKNFMILRTSRPQDLDTGYPYVGLQLLKTKRNCLFDTKVFQQNAINSLIPNVQIFEDVIISTISTPNEPCSITHMIQIDELSSTVSTMTKVWTTSKSENVTVFVGGNQSKILFTFNSKTHDSWHDIVLASNLYTIEIPKNSSVFMVISYLPFQKIVSESDAYIYSSTSVRISQFPYRSVATTACYGVSKEKIFCKYPVHQTYIIENVTVKFTAKYLNLPKRLEVSMRVNSTGKEHKFKQVNDYFTFKNEVVMFGYSNISLAANYSIYDDNNGVLISVEALNDTVI